MTKAVADMMLVARKALLSAKASGNKRDMERAVELAVKVISHPQAGGFFSSLSSVLGDLDESELFGNDPDVLNNDGDPVDPTLPDPEYDDMDSDEPDEDSESSNPADEGLVNHDEDSESANPDGDDEPEPDDGHIESAFYRMKLIQTSTMPRSTTRRLAANFRKFK
jgi:hypothetical protein